MKLTATCTARDLALLLGIERDAVWPFVARTPPLRAALIRRGHRPLLNLDAVRQWAVARGIL